jgi:hypothetical protein
MVNLFGVRALVGTLLCLAMSTHAFAEDTVQAAWREIKLEFPFLSRTTGYYCHRVNKKVERVLQLAGAHPDTKVKVRGCRFEQPTGNLHFTIETAVPVLAPPKRKGEAAPAEPSRWGAESFAATWKQINLAREIDADLRPNDCELMRALDVHLFSQMTVTVDKKPEVCRSDATKQRMQDFIVTALTAVHADD